MFMTSTGELCNSCDTKQNCRVLFFFSSSFFERAGCLFDKRELFAILFAGKENKQLIFNTVLYELYLSSYLKYEHNFNPFSIL